ncbi:MAG: orotidine-5'-phosphate decarboxylase [Pseudomonadota bacterium]|nr:orotidine-5'-phosphate decarboxylase [Pseudomonadota bacterium]
MTDISPVDRLFCAIDTSKLDDALLLADLLSGEIGTLKLGKEFFTAHGPEGVRKVAAFGHKIFLDLKYHDIPNTVAGAIRATQHIECEVLTVHASGGSAMLRAAVEAANGLGERPLKIVAVTVLTSLNDSDLETVGQVGAVSDQVLHLARLAEACGLSGVVCSPWEVNALRSEMKEDFALVVPGVRPEWASEDDQKRVMTPGEAVAAGADYLVIGRPITRAPDPVGAARRIIDEMIAATP